MEWGKSNTLDKVQFQQQFHQVLFQHKSATCGSSISGLEISCHVCLCSCGVLIELAFLFFTKHRPYYSVWNLRIQLPVDVKQRWTSEFWHLALGVPSWDLASPFLFIHDHPMGYGIQMHIRDRNGCSGSSSPIFFILLSNYRTGMISLTLQILAIFAQAFCDIRLESIKLHMFLLLIPLLLQSLL